MYVSGSSYHLLPAICLRLKNITAFQISIQPDFNTPGSHIHRATGIKISENSKALDKKVET